MSAASRTTRRKTTAKSTSRKAKKTTRRGTSGGGTRRKTGSRTARKTGGGRRRTSVRTRLAAVIEKLDRAFGPIQLPETTSVLEKAVYLVLREKGTENTTARAMKALREDFVDWNEVRVSRPAELSRLMSGSSKAAAQRRYEDRSRRVREMIDQIYGDQNAPTLEFLVGERPKVQLEYLEDLDDLGLHNAYALVQWLAGDEEKLVLVSSEMAKAAQTLGLTESAAVTKVRKELSELVSGLAALVTLQAHLNQLGNLEPGDWPGAVKELLD